MTDEDISKPMLNVGVEREVSGDTMLLDMGDGLPFRSGMFDGAISVSIGHFAINIVGTIGHFAINVVGTNFFDPLDLRCTVVVQC